MMPNRLPVRHCPAHAVIPPVLRTIGFISTYVPESGLIPFHPIRILLKENRKSAQIGISHSADIACAPTVVPVASVRVLPLIWDMEAMTNGKLFRNYPLI